MVNEWATRPLKRCATWYSGGTPRKSTPEYWGGAIPWISAKSLKEFFVCDSEDKVTELGAQNGTRLIPANTILFIVRGMSLKSEFRIGITTRPVTFNQDLKALVAKEDILPSFLAYAIKAKTPSILGLVGEAGHGTGVLPTDRIQDLEIPVPPLPEQKAIAHVLGTLDDRIELNRRMNETLESMAQVLFKSWFVDFDPVIDNALTSGKEIPEELSEKAQARAALGDKRQSMPEEIRSLFPDEFSYSDELGWVPKGWEVKPIDKAIEINPKVKLKKGEVAKFVDMKALPTSGFSVAGIIKKSYAGGAKFNNGDVLLARITPCLENGKTGVVDFLRYDEVGFGSTEFIVLRGKGALYTSFVACLARDAAFRAHCVQSMVGSSGRQRVQNACFSSFHIALPSVERLLTTFGELTGEAFKKYRQHREQSEILANLRDTLLPKLLSGELRIPDAEKMVEELAL